MVSCEPIKRQYLAHGLKLNNTAVKRHEYLIYSINFKGHNVKFKRREVCETAKVFYVKQAIFSPLKRIRLHEEIRKA